MECLKGLIGITQNDCECLGDEIEEEFKTSLSGYYFDESAYSVDIRQWQEIVGCQDLSEKINGFINNAGQILFREISITLNRVHDVRDNIAKLSMGVIGSRLEQVKEGDEFIFMFSSVARGKGARFFIENIANSWTGDFDIEIESNEKDNERTSNIKVTVTALEDGTYIHTKSGCTSCPNSREKNQGFGLNLYKNGLLVKKSTAGFEFELSVNCTIEDAICQVMENKNQRKTLGAIIQKIAIREGLKYVKNTFNFDRFSVMNTEIREDDIHKLKAEYMRDINEWLLPNLKLDKTGCFPCDSSKGSIHKNWF